jgi:hypothetical protein
MAKKLRIDTTTETFFAEVPNSTTATDVKAAIDNGTWLKATDSKGVVTLIRTFSITNVRLE